MLYELLLVLMVLLPLLWLRFVEKKKWKKVMKNLIPKYQGHKKEIVGTLALFSALLLAFVVITACITTIEIASGTQINDLDKVSGIVQEDFVGAPWLFALTLIVMLFIEEFFFRAFLVPRIGMILPTILFTIAHLGYGSWMEILGVFLLGLVLAYWFKKKKSLFQNYFGHLLYDILAVALYLL